MEEIITELSGNVLRVQLNRLRGQTLPEKRQFSHPSVKRSRNSKQDG